MSGHYNRGIQLYNLAKYNEAIKSFKSDLAENPHEFYAKYYLALCFYHINDFSNFEKTSNALIADYPDSDEIHFLYSFVYSSKDDYKNAIKHLNKAIQLNPYEAEYFGQQSINLLNLKKYEKALSSSNLGLQINPKNNTCLNTRTKALTKLNRKQEAFETLQNTLHENPEDYFTHANAGWTNLELGNYKTANKHFKEALKLDPNDDYARNGMVESIKAKNIIYRSFLKYAFWIQNKDSKFQWLFIIGIYIGYRFISKVADGFGFTFLLPIFAIIYLGLVLGSWLISPISNAILLFDSYGKYLLNREDKNAGYGFILVTSVAIIASIGYYINSNNIMLLIAISSFCSLIPITKGLQKSIRFYKNLTFWYGIVIFILGFINIIYPISIMVPIILFVIFTWGYNFKRLK
ncbi:hypothetical protein WH52_09305 [Tenacibaculum holothuriorum]|uniref:Uncharacterized protein n=1 Tax=Tenacibaculum holothuriorum TaxID=1635173 RepID=A0A1Y2PC93_9FLAO|nr:tetratricopeptide repeat protein [Tenacibaculum holothuriorum]OSY87631.1 hypothetical protein WH52_09305 [Tenacibaculum holothuriorum]